MKDNTRFLIVGLGLIGGSYAKGLKAKGYYVGAIDNDINAVNFALANNIIDSGYTEIKEDYIASFDIIIFALYPHVLISWLKENQKYIKSNALLTDVTGVKGKVIKEVNNILRKDLDFVFSHPMAGREVSGVINCDNNIFKGANFLIVPNENNKKENIELIKEIGTILEFQNISIISADEHDDMIAFVSQLTHCIAVSLMNCKDDEESRNLVYYTGDSFRDLTRIARINEEMWCELFLYNKQALIKEIETFENELSILKEAIKNNDEKTIKDKMITSTYRRGFFNKKN